MKRYVRSAIDTTPIVQDFMHSIEDIYYQKFPDSLCRISLRNSSMPYSQYIEVNCYLAKNVFEKYKSTDLFLINVCIKFPEGFYDLTMDNDVVPDKMTLIFMTARIIADITDRNDYHKNDIRRRAYTANYKKILSAWKKFVDKLYITTVNLYEQGEISENMIKHMDIEKKLSLK